MAPAKVTDAFQATKRGRGVVKGKSKAKSARTAGTYPFVRLVLSLDASKVIPTRFQPRRFADIPDLPQKPNPRTTPRRGT